MRFWIFFSPQNLNQNQDGPNVWVIYLYMTGEKWPHSKGSVGKHSVLGTFGAELNVLYVQKNEHVEQRETSEQKNDWFFG